MLSCQVVQTGQVGDSILFDVIMEEYFLEQESRDLPPSIHSDDLNDETFGEKAIEDDWESSHYSKVREMEGNPLPLHHDDVILKAIPSMNHNRKAQGEDEEVISSLSQMKIKELWPSSPEQASHLESIWTSPELPTVNSKFRSSPSLPSSDKVVRLEDLERELTSSPPHPPPSHQHTSPLPLYQHTPQQARSGPLPPPPGLVRAAPPSLVHAAMPMHPQMMQWWHQRGPFPPPPPHMLPPPPIPFIRAPHLIHGMPNQMMAARMPPPPPHLHYPPPPPHAHPPPQHLPHPHHQSPQTSRRTRRSEFLNELKPDGSGFMTQKEKEWVIKVQLLQLQSQDPSTDDYYYQHYTQQKVSKERQRGGSDSPPASHILTLPQLTWEERSYKPVEFKGTLGKLSVSTISAPRKTIDIPISGPEGPGGGGKDAPTRKKQTLMTIEKLYMLVLSLEDLERRALSLPEEDRSLMLAQRDEICSEMFSLLKLKTLDEQWNKGDEQVFQHVMTYRKGKRVIGRALLLLSDAYAHAVVFSLVRNMATIIKRDSSDQVLPELIVGVVAVLASMDLGMVNQVMAAVVEGTGTPAAVKIAQNEFGSLVLLALVRRGKEEALSEQTNYSAHAQERWGELTRQLCVELLPHKEQLSASSSTLLTTLTTLTS